MCELFGMSARFPSNVRVSLDELARHGGGTAHHRDGWGVAFLQEGDAFVVREPSAANESACLSLLRGQEIASATVIAHIRKATQGARLLRNTQPFTRELGGVVHVFAHNGTLPGIEGDTRFCARRFRRVGDTDSEHAFCALLDRLAPLWERAAERAGELGRERAVPPVEERREVVEQFAADLRARGPANFLYADGDALFAHGHKRTNARGEVTPPGLHLLCASCRPGAPHLSIEGLHLSHDEDQRVALVASVPLSAAPWEPLPEGVVLVLREGELLSSAGR
jgi:predicted glutamine amidotransferase